MSRNHSENVLDASLVALSDAPSPIQEKLSVRLAKRAAKAAERCKKSDALKEEGNTFYRAGKFLDALDRYQQAIAVHKSAKPVLLANLAATYLKLNLFSEAHEAAEVALLADPKSVKARYRRATARKHLGRLSGAEADFRVLYNLDAGNKVAEVEWGLVIEESCSPSYEEAEEDLDSYSDLEAPRVDDDPQLGDSLSESSDCEHTGNGIPCKFYNRTECKRGRTCRYSHAPDDKSERDALGRNVCRYYLIDVCKYGERWTYLHSKEYLLQKGWWSTTEGVEKERRRYNLLQMCNKAIADYNNQARASGMGRTSKKKTTGKKKSRAAGARNQSTKIQPTSAAGQSSRMKYTKSERNYSDFDGYDSDSDNGLGMCGFSSSQVVELASHGMKPWDDDAWDVMGALNDYDYY